MRERKKQIRILDIAVAGVFMGMIAGLASFGIPVPGGNFYLCDVVITIAAVLLPPETAFLTAGFGTFLGDALFYPQTMMLSFFVHGLQAFVISRVSHYGKGTHPVISSIWGAALGTFLMAGGYALGKVVLWGNLPMALAGIPFDLVQGGVGSAFGLLLVYGSGLKTMYMRLAARSRHI